MNRQMQLIEMRSRPEWRAWLKANHRRQRVAWLVYHKPGASRSGIDYESSVQEALCFGWIDSMICRIDEHRYVRMFTPRSKSSAWSIPNRKRAMGLLASKRMTAAGRALLPADLHDQSLLVAEVRRPPRPPRDLSAALAANATARANFAQFAPGQRRVFLGWLAAAKRPETRQRRIAEIVRRAAANIRTLMPS